MDKGKNAFYQAYPDYETFTLENQSTFTGNQDTKEKMIEALYNYYVSAYSYDYNYKADQYGVISGSIVLVIGVVAFIVFLILKKKKSS